jgi:broad specificity phosphatase PhoE
MCIRDRSWLNGAVAARARELGLAAPVNTAFAEVLLDLVEGRDQRQVWEDQPGRLLAAVAGKELLMP